MTVYYYTDLLITGSITATKELMGVKGSFVTDDTNIYAVTSEVKREQISGGVVYIPLIEIRTPSRDDISLSGHVTSLIGKSVSADLTLAGLSLQPLSLKCESFVAIQCEIFKKMLVFFLVQNCL